MTYLILDCARMQLENLRVFQDMEPMHSSLYLGDAEKDLQEFAPYLFLTTAGTMELFLQKSKAQSWGIAAISSSPFEDLKRHFRRFLRVKMESGQTMLFRFYDPRVLRIFLPTCSPEQLREFFGPVKFFYTETEDGAAYTRWWLQNDQLKSDILTSDDLKVSEREELRALGTPSPQAQSKVERNKGNSWID
jgi:hypothetical protein